MISLEETIKFLRDAKTIKVGESFDLAKATSSLLTSFKEDDLEVGRQTVIHVLDQWEKIPKSTRSMWSDLIEACGFYPYLAKDASDRDFTNLPGLIRKGIHHSPHIGKFLHEEQKRLLEIFDSGKNLIVSAPTSFGKSLLIEELVARKNFKNVVIVQPTLALLEETRKNLKKYKDDYRLIIKTSQNYSEEGKNIFLLTAERILEYPEFPNIDLLIIDEFYKISAARKDDRADILNAAFYRLLKKYNPRFYLLGPNIDGISAGFAEKYNAQFYKTNYSLVVADIVDLRAKYQEEFSHPIKNKKFIEDILFKTLKDLNSQQTLIYCSSPERTRELSKKFLDYLKENDPNIVQKENSLTKWINENISSHWSTGICLSYGIGVHDAALPRHLSSSIIHLFNRNEINYLFCTSTIIEGVNTSAKNVVIFDKTKGGAKLDFFDYSNIKGRAGRLMVHYSGRVFNFNSVPKFQKLIIDFPFYDQDDLTTEEVFIHLHKEDVKNTDAESYKSIEKLTAEEKEIFRRNGVSVSGQKQILTKIEEDLKTDPSLIIWSGYPNRYQRQYVIDNGWEFLKRPGEKSLFSIKKIDALTGIYSQSPEIIKLVADEVRYARENNKAELSPIEIIDRAVRMIFQFQRHWLGYTLPKWFHVFNSLQHLACKKMGMRPGDYTFYATSLENDFISPKLTFLLEMGIPRTAVAKIEGRIGTIEDENKIVEFIRSHLQTLGLTTYEIEKINEL